MSSATDAMQAGSPSKDRLASIVRPYSQSPLNHILVLMSSFIFAGAGYVLSAGDARNGSGISTAWSLTYLFLNLRKSLMPPRSPVSLALTGATVASSVLYGSEYFLLQGNS
ncbi:hypothetical protein B0H21DRAFT_739992 [Amylocystis lapponica]|nr:hypothetical protein B0H21DRAFT_739992 [Amylocystis lapponica]